MIKEIFDYIPQFSPSKKNAVLDQIIKTSKSCDLKCCKWQEGYRIQNITQTLKLFEAAEENY